MVPSSHKKIPASRSDEKDRPSYGLIGDVAGAIVQQGQAVATNEDRPAVYAGLFEF
jgi:hypothetical protein